MKDDKVLYDSDDAAKYVTNVEGWVSRGGRFYGKDEHLARYDGCTHVKCKRCDNIIQKPRYMCNSCLEKVSVEQYNKKQQKEWDFETPLYSLKWDKFFFDYGEVYDFLEEERTTFEEARMVLCEPVSLRYVEPDYWSDQLPEDGDLPDELLDAIDELNNTIDYINGNEGFSSWEPSNFAWEPSKYAAVIPTK